MMLSVEMHQSVKSLHDPSIPDGQNPFFIFFVNCECHFMSTLRVLHDASMTFVIITKWVQNMNHQVSN